MGGRGSSSFRFAAGPASAPRSAASRASEATEPRRGVAARSSRGRRGDARERLGLRGGGAVPTAPQNDSATATSSRASLQAPVAGPPRRSSAATTSKAAVGVGPSAVSSHSPFEWQATSVTVADGGAASTWAGRGRFDAASTRAFRARAFRNERPRFERAPRDGRSSRISRNEWKPAESGAFEVGHVAPVSRADARGGGEGQAREVRQGAEDQRRRREARRPVDEDGDRRAHVPRLALARQRGGGQRLGAVREVGRAGPPEDELVVEAVHDDIPEDLPGRPRAPAVVRRDEVDGRVDDAREGPAAVEPLEERPRDLRGNQIFNPTSMFAYATVSTQGFLPCFENSTRAIDSSKSQPNRLRFDRDREF